MYCNNLPKQLEYQLGYLDNLVHSGNTAAEAYLDNRQAAVELSRDLLVGHGFVCNMPS